MFFGRRLRHPLPKFPATVIPAFRQLCREIGVEHLGEVRGEVEHCLAELRNRAANYPHLNLPLAEDVAARCLLLLEHFERSDVESRKLIMGAVSYFVVDDDGAGDDSFATGFDDDARVVNHVLEQLGIEDHFIDVR